MMIDDALSQHDVGSDALPPGKGWHACAMGKRGLAASGRSESRFLDLPGDGIDPHGIGPTGRSEPRIMRGKCLLGKYLAAWLAERRYSRRGGAGR